MTQTHNNKVSEHYNRYIVGVRYKDVLYYTVWGPDATAEQDDDKVLVDTEGKMLLFADVNLLPVYIAQHIDELYDKGRFKGWVEDVEKPFVAYTIKAMDRLVSLKQDMKDEHDIEALVNSVHLLFDYAYQVCDHQLMELYESRAIADFIDAYMDEYFWAEPSGHKFYKLFLKAQLAFVSMYKRFEECAVIKKT